MGYKTISLSDEAYRMLASVKRRGESFTDVIYRLCSRASKKPLASFAGAWTMSDREEKEVFSAISELWKEYEANLFGHGFSGSSPKKPSRSR